LTQEWPWPSPPVRQGEPRPANGQAPLRSAGSIARRVRFHPHLR
jgi:hypothetical protein